MPTPTETQQNQAARNFSKAPTATNWIKPDAPAKADDYWVDTQVGDDVIRPWDKLILGGTPFPGLWKVAPSTSISFEPNKILKNPGSTKQGIGPKFKIVLTPKGYNPATIIAKGEIWTGADWKTFKKAIATIAPKKTNDSAPRAFAISHPGCAVLGIDQVIITNVGLPDIVNQTLLIQITMMQYFPQGPVYTTYGNYGSAKLPPATPPNANNNVSTK